MTTIKGRSAETAAMPEKAHTAEGTEKLTLAQILEIVTGSQLPLRFTAYDGSC